MSGPTLLVSPHPDDAVMSSFGIIAKGFLPRPLNLLTVFSWSDYSVLYRRIYLPPRTLMRAIPRPNELFRSIGRNAGLLGSHPRRFLWNLLDLGETYKISRIRLFEDLEFSKRIGARFFYANLPDARIRYGRAIMDPSWSLETEQVTIGKILNVLGDVISKAKVNALVAPWPYGARQHVDHRLVNEAVVRAAEDTGIKLCYVDDQPYSRRPLGPLNDRRGCAYTPTVARLNPRETKMKYETMSIYESQMSPEYFEAVGKPPPGSPDQVQSETLWEPG